MKHLQPVLLNEYKFTTMWIHSQLHSQKQSLSLLFEWCYYRLSAQLFYVIIYLFSLNERTITLSSLKRDVRSTCLSTHFTVTFLTCVLWLVGSHITANTYSKCLDIFHIVFTLLPCCWKARLWKYPWSQVWILRVLIRYMSLPFAHGAWSVSDRTGDHMAGERFPPSLPLRAAWQLDGC